MSDLIRRSDAIRAMQECFQVLARQRVQAVKMIEAIPTIEPKRGEWVFDEKGYFFCSECKRKPNDQYATTDFCPNCGCAMTKE